MLMRHTSDTWSINPKYVRHAIQYILPLHYMRLQHTFYRFKSCMHSRSLRDYLRTHVIIVSMAPIHAVCLDAVDYSVLDAESEAATHAAH